MGERKLFLKPPQHKPDCKCCKPGKPCSNHQDWHPPEELKELSPEEFAHLSPPSGETPTQWGICSICGRPAGDFTECLACWKTQQISLPVSGKQMQWSETLTRGVKK